jgi:hypothetical protein
MLAERTGDLVALLILGWQIFGWLRTGTWPSLPLGSVALPLLHGTPFSAWMAEPHSWLGLHWVVAFLLNLPLALWVFASVLLVARVLSDISEKSN